jgi:hypothetical protein
MDTQKNLLSVSFAKALMPFDPLLLPIHFAKHQRDFQVNIDRAYEALADAFVTGAISPSIMLCNRKNGDLLRYDIVTQEFAVVSGPGTVRAYFKPVPCSSLPIGVPKIDCHGHRDNVTYFQVECAK